MLEPIWVEKRETANRVRGRIETIIAKNVDINDRDFRNPAELTNSSAKSFRNGRSVSSATTPPCPTPTALVGLVTFYIALRLVLRYYFPPDT